MPKSEKGKKEHWAILWQILSAWLILAAQNQSAGLCFGILSIDPFPPPSWLFRDKFLGPELNLFLKRITQASSLSNNYSFCPPGSKATPRLCGRAKQSLKNTHKQLTLRYLAVCAQFCPFPWSSPLRAGLYWTSKTNTEHRNDTERAQGHENSALGT